ncbi:uncharacterized protein EV420DRAFT_1499558 [Desarmillaria tabescens]|uniref:Uncharacterized protein n=1 Tax=Armillaria tabescens TaxID=1929756 RepID=A0AA39TU74_ARMTA|nr:uncharacterized protein EV420DRAFT_1499558 [Desarmillaria tabescens]KAK0470277.1 hypothetical protein EV420DRAFT_1499558 [Desarmillaria tabescens]
MIFAPQLHYGLACILHVISSIPLLDGHVLSMVLIPGSMARKRTLSRWSHCAAVAEENPATCRRALVQMPDKELVVTIRTAT